MIVMGTAATISVGEVRDFADRLAAWAGELGPDALGAPGSESELLATAQSVPLHKLRDVCGDVELRADTSDGRERRRAHRAARVERAPDGMLRFEALGPNDEAGEIKAVWDCFTDR